MVAGQKASLSQQSLDSMWNSFDEQILTPIKAIKIPFGFTVGNHDASPNFSRAIRNHFSDEYQHPGKGRLS